MEAAVKLDHVLLALDGEHDVNAMVEIVAPELETSDAREPLRVALVVDRSGSMSGRKLEVAKRCASWLVSRLDPRDQLALVDYDDEVRLLAPLSTPGAAHRAAIDRIHAGGSTNLSGGWLKGVEALGRTNGPGPRKVLLLSDGLANVGITEPGVLTALAANVGKQGIGTTTIGIGEDFDEELMTALAEAGGGYAHFAETPDAAPAIFSTELEGLTSIVAQNVSLEIRPGLQVEVLEILNDRPLVPVPGGVQVELGDAYAGERRRVVFALHVPHLAALGPVSVAEAVLRYVSVGDEIAQHELTIPIVANAVSAEEASRAVPDAEVREEVLVLRAARAREDAMKLADAGDFTAAHGTLTKVVGELRDAGSPELAAEADLLETLSAEVNAEAYTPLHRKHLHYQSWQSRQGRHRNGP